MCIGQGHSPVLSFRSSKNVAAERSWQGVLSDLRAIQTHRRCIDLAKYTAQGFIVTLTQRCVSALYPLVMYVVRLPPRLRIHIHQAGRQTLPRADIHGSFTGSHVQSVLYGAEQDRWRCSIPFRYKSSCDFATTKKFRSPSKPSPLLHRFRLYVDRS